MAAYILGPMLFLHDVFYCLCVAWLQLTRFDSPFLFLPSSLQPLCSSAMFSNTTRFHCLLVETDLILKESLRDGVNKAIVSERAQGFLCPPLCLFSDNGQALTP